MIDAQLIIITAIIGIFVTVILYISKIFNNENKASEIISEESNTKPNASVPMEIGKSRKKSESVRTR